MAFGIALGGFQQGRDQALQRGLESEKIGLLRGQLDETKEQNRLKVFQTNIQAQQKMAADMAAGYQKQVLNEDITLDEAYEKLKPVVDHSNKMIAVSWVAMGQDPSGAPLLSVDQLMAGTQTKTQVMIDKAREAALTQGAKTAAGAENFVIVKDFTDPNAQAFRAKQLPTGGLTTLNGDPLPSNFIPISKPETQTTPGEAGLTKPTTTALEKRMVSLREQLAKSKALLSTVDPSFFSFQGKVKTATAQVKDFFELSDPADKERIAKARVMFEDISKVFNAYRKEITGAAAAVQELEKLEKSIVNANLLPGEVIPSIQNLIRDIELSLSVVDQVRNEGLDPTSDAAASRIDKLMVEAKVAAGHTKSLGGVTYMKLGNNWFKVK